MKKQFLARNSRRSGDPMHGREAAQVSDHDCGPVSGSMIVPKPIPSGFSGPRVTLTALGKRKLRALCSALGTNSHQTASAFATFARLTEPWLERVPADAPVWHSDITDDHSPFEFSVSLERQRREVRMLVEAQDDRMTHHQGWEPALDLTRAIALEPGVSLARFERIAELFAPDAHIPARFSLWHAAAVPDSGPVLYKLYLNPQVLGAAAAPGLVREALKLLNIPQAWHAIEALLAVSAGRNEILYFALDLTDTPHARVKVYVAHHSVRTAALEHQLAFFRTYEPGDATWLTRTLANSDGPFCQRPVLSCLSIADASPDPQVTLHFPIRCYARDDAAIIRRLQQALGEPSGSELADATNAYAGRSLDAGRGLITYVSIRRSLNEGVRVVTYLSPEAYRVEPAEEDSRRYESSAAQSRSASDSRGVELTMQDVLHHIADRQDEIARHPFIESLRRADDEGHDMKAMAKGLTFFVMAFQDVLRLTARRVSDPRLVEIARTHYTEDSGHEQWFLHDLKALDIDVSVGFIFSSLHEVSRDVGYALVAEVLGAKDDYDRLAVIYALEAVGHAFFEPAIGVFEQRNLASQLKYFARHHQEVERDHQLFESDVEGTLARSPLSAERFVQVLATVDRVFDQMTILADDILPRLTRAAPSGAAECSFGKEHGV